LHKLLRQRVKQNESRRWRIHELSHSRRTKGFGELLPSLSSVGSQSARTSYRSDLNLGHGGFTFARHSPRNNPAVLSGMLPPNSWVLPRSHEGRGWPGQKLGLDTLTDAWFAPRPNLRARKLPVL
jgi:hypothetical protein